MRFKLPPAANAAHFCYAARTIASYEPAKFTSLFGITAEVTAIAWNLCKDDWLGYNLQPKHMLWALMFLKSYAKESLLCATANTSRPTFRKWIWKVIKVVCGKIPSVVSTFCLSAIQIHFDVSSFKSNQSLTTLMLQILWSKRFEQDKGLTCKVYVDGTDYMIAEPTPFSKEWYCYKHGCAGLRYEIATCIQTGHIVWVNGPFKCGKWPDIKIFRRNLKQRLLPCEMVECDRGYRGDQSCRHADIVFNRADQRAKGRAAARHETVNGDLKRFGCLKQVFRHAKELHKQVFGACVVLTQLGYNIGEGPKFQVTY